MITLKLTDSMSSTAPVGYGGVCVLMVNGETLKQELSADNLAIIVTQVKCVNLEVLVFCSTMAAVLCP